MEKSSTIFDCIIVGGPEHARRVQLTCDSNPDILPALMTEDGLVCSPAGFRRADDGAVVWFLMHPHATGSELREQIALTDDSHAECTRQLRRIYAKAS